MEVEVSEMTVSFEILGDKDEWGGDGDTGFLCAKVKGKQMVMTLEVWEDIVGFLSKGMMENDKGLKDAGVKLNKVTKNTRN